MRIALLVLTFCAFAVHAAQADQWDQAAPMSDGLVTAAVDYADTWWSDLGSPPPCAHHAVLSWSDEPGEWAHAALGACRVAFSRREVSRLRWYLAHGRLPGEGRFVGGVLYRRGYLTTLCAIAIHERGHSIGYTHDAGGIMALFGPYVAPPGGCVLWAARMLPRRHR